MDIDWAIPWSTAQLIDFIFLVVCCIVVTSVPVVYFFRANLRDHFARAILAGTGVTAVAFDLTMVVVISIHAGWVPTEEMIHWMTRTTYTAVALGKGAFLIALVRVARNNKRVATEHYDMVEDAHEQANVEANSRE